MTARSRLDDLAAKRLTDALKEGMSRTAAARLAGVSPSIYRDAGDDLRARIQRAEAEAEQTAVKAIMVAAERGDWRACAWWLERRHTARWSAEQAQAANEDVAESPTQFMTATEALEWWREREAEIVRMAIAEGYKPPPLELEARDRVKATVASHPDLFRDLLAEVSDERKATAS